MYLKVTLFLDRMWSHGLIAEFSPLSVSRASNQKRCEIETILGCVYVMEDGILCKRFPFQVGCPSSPPLLKTQKPRPMRILIWHGKWLFLHIPQPNFTYDYEYTKMGICFIILFTSNIILSLRRLTNGNIGFHLIFHQVGDSSK